MSITKHPETGSVELKGYRVEARSNSSVQTIFTINGKHYGTEWNAVETITGPTGVPAGYHAKYLALGDGLLTMEQAMAIAWWFIAEAEKTHCYMQVRVVEFTLNASWKCEESGRWLDLPDQRQHLNAFSSPAPDPA